MRLIPKDKVNKLYLYVYEITNGPMNSPYKTQEVEGINIPLL